MQETKKIAIVGSGLVGSLLGIYLRKAGHTVHIFDRSPDIRSINFSGRSINLAMSNRGWKALDEAGIGADIRKIAIPLAKRAIHIGTQISNQFYGKDGECIYSISRGVLNKKMIDLAENAGVTFFFEHKVWDITLSEATLHVGESEHEAWTDLKYDMVFGADGAFSRIRHRMQRQNRFNYSQEFLDIGYKELNIPANSDGSYKLDQHALHIWPRGQYMLIALPNLDGSFTCTLFMPFEGKNSLESLQSKQEVEDFFKENLPDTVDIIPNLVEDFFKNPTSTLVTMKCYPWTFENKVALIGDAAHAIVPFYGQGMNAGFEDITVLYDMIQQHPNDWSAIFMEYQKSRKPNADAIAELSFRNFVEMSTKTADTTFILQKKIEKHFSEKHPDKWVPLYSRVTFSHRPYSEALAQGEAQDKIMQKILAIDGINELWNSTFVENEILKLLECNG